MSSFCGQGLGGVVFGHCPVLISDRELSQNAVRGGASAVVSKGEKGSVFGLGEASLV